MGVSTVTPRVSPGHGGVQRPGVEKDKCHDDDYSGGGGGGGDEKRRKYYIAYVTENDLSHRRSRIGAPFAFGPFVMPVVRYSLTFVT